MEIFVIAIILSIVPAMIANNKGRQFFPWFIYSLIILPIAFVHSLLISNKLADVKLKSNPLSKEGNSNVKTEKKLISLALARDEKPEVTSRKFSAKELKKSPIKFSKFLKVLRKIPIVATGVKDNLAYVKIDSGMKFYSPISAPTIRRQYKFIKDTIPNCITEDTYLASIDLAFRYYYLDSEFPPKSLINKNVNIVEIGAYLGHKTIRFAQHSQKFGGKILAVEMMPENYLILKKNINMNKLNTIVDTMNYGVWSESGEKIVHSKGRQKNSLIPIPSLQNGDKVLLKIRSLSSILKEWGRTPVDILYITVNGAEVEILRNFNPLEFNIKYIYIHSPYKAKGHEDNAVFCKNYLIDMGYTLLPSYRVSTIIGQLRL